MPGSRRGETWTCAGGNEIKKEGREAGSWRTDLGTITRGVFKVGPMSRLLISVDRLQGTGHDVILTKNKPRIVNLRTGEVMPLRKDGGMFILDLWIWVPTSRSKTESCSDFARQRSLHSKDLVSPCSDPADKQVAGGGCTDITSHDEDILTLNVDGEALEEEIDVSLRTKRYRMQGPSQTQDSPARTNVRSTRQHMRSAEAVALHA